MRGSPRTPRWPRPILRRIPAGGADSSARAANGNRWINCAVVLAYTTFLNVAFAGSGVSVFSVWSCLVVFFTSRVLMNMSRIRRKQFLRTSVAG